MFLLCFRQVIWSTIILSITPLFEAVPHGIPLGKLPVCLHDMTLYIRLKAY